MKWKLAIGRFLRDTRGGATSIAAVGVTIMTLGGGALIIDHNRMVGQRDILQSASDAASLAATLELNRLPDTASAADARTRVEGVARKYAVLNVLANAAVPDISAQDVSISFDIDHGTRIVNATVQADIAKTLVAGWLHGVSGPGTVQTVSGVESLDRTVEVVLAVDVSRSMNLDLDENRVGWEDSASRMAIVKEAARALVSTLASESSEGVAFGIVPWDVKVRLNRKMREAWAAEGWAVYPRSRHYAVTYRCAPNRTCTSRAANNTLPATPPEEWAGCLDEHRVTEGHANLTPDSDWFDHPSHKAFAQGIFPPAFGRAYECMREPTPGNFAKQYCYGEDIDSVPHVIPGHAPQSCGNGRRPMLPLTTDRAEVDEFIDLLKPADGATYSALGLLWAQRLLTPDWKDVWGGAVHPMDNSDKVHKAIVLLTDGEDSQCGKYDRSCRRSNLGYLRAPVCTAVKAAGTEIFVVAAMPRGEIKDWFGRRLTDCSSQGEGNGTYVFLGHDDGESIKAAFVEIARQLRGVRRIY